MKRLYTSESVLEGHPDKMCDKISDSILDAYLAEDPNSRVACETVVGKGMVIVTGEVTSEARIDIESIVRGVVKKIGYTGPNDGFDYMTSNKIININKQSPDIAQGVDSSADKDCIGAGDQGMMFGYATNECEGMIPYPLYLAHRLAERIDYIRHIGLIEYLKPDGKVQVTVEYDDNTVKRIESIVVSVQHKEHIEVGYLTSDIMEYVIEHIVPAELVDRDTKYYINPSGRFVEGGPDADTGLTGRKIMVDTYGGYARHGGGAFSGKDATKVDRSGAYMARYVAKNIVGAGLADKCEVQLSYVIGMSEPASVNVETFGTGKLPDDKLIEIVRQNFDLTPKGIIESLDLTRPIFSKTSVYGHFGKDDLTWERLDRVGKLSKYLK